MPPAESGEIHVVVCRGGGGWGRPEREPACIANFPKGKVLKKIQFNHLFEAQRGALVNAPGGQTMTSNMGSAMSNDVLELEGAKEVYLVSKELSR